MTNNRLTETQYAIEQLFELEGIKQVVCVDDQYREFPEDMINDIIGELKADSSLQQQISEKIEKFNDIQWDEEDIWIEQLKEKWTDASLEERKYYHNLLTGSDNSPEAKDIEYSSKLKELLEQVKGVELKEISFSAWNAARDKYLDNENVKRTLFLFDQDLTKEGGRETEGIEIIKLLSKKYRNKKIRCGLLSHTFSPKDEYRSWKEFADEHQIKKDRFTLISKTHLTEDPFGFARMLRLTLMNRHCENVKNRVSNIITKAFKKSKKELDELHIYDFEDIVFRSSFNEGIWEPDTLFRLYSLYQRKEARSLAIENNMLRGLANSIRELRSVSIGERKENYGKLRKIRRSELYEDGKYINALHMPIEPGDIFLKTGTSKKFILLGQPCNLMVRENGKRGPRDFSEVVLVQIVDEKKKGKAEDSSYELSYFDENEGKNWYVDFRKTHTVLLCVLDLCVFNDDGQAKIIAGGNCPESVIPSWKKRFEILQYRADKIIKRYTEFQREKIKKKDLNFLIPKSSHDKGGLFKAKIDCGKAGRSITYGCQRVGRLCQPRAGAMLTKYAYYISRAAFEHDFAKENER